jgi:signal peptidase I
VPDLVPSPDRTARRPGTPDPSRFATLLPADVPYPRASDEGLTRSELAGRRWAPAASSAEAPADDPRPDPATAPIRPGRTVGSLARTLAYELAKAWLVLVTALIGWSVGPVAIGWHPVLVTGASMAPAVSPGDVVLLQRDARIRPGTIVLAHGTRADGQDVMHRVVAVRPDGSLTTRGDANPGADTAPVPAAQVGGAVRMVVPGAGRIALAAAAVTGRLRDDGHPPPLGRDDLVWLGGCVLALAVVGGRRVRS